MEEDSFLYVIGAPDGPQKVGVAKEPAERLVIMQVSHLGRLELAAKIRMPRLMAFAAERCAHWILREKRIRGEWFEVSPAEAIEAAEMAHKQALNGEQKPRAKGQTPSELRTDPSQIPRGDKGAHPGGSGGERAGCGVHPRRGREGAKEAGTAHLVIAA
jgi:hypothetical protein